MKRYILHPGAGKVTPLHKMGYISGRQLAACYNVPYSECLDTDNKAILKVLSFNQKRNGPPSHLIPLLPRSDGHYILPTKKQGKIMLLNGFPEMVNKNG